jgi:arabinogalactan endo-1,4-beta-galactosidase
LRELAARFDKPILLAETAYPWTLAWFDDTHNVVGQSQQLLPGFPASPSGQAAFVRQVWSTMKTLPPRARGGVVYWEPAWLAGGEAGSSWENMTLFDERGRPLPGLDALGSP